jgi:hypothetical protein
MGARNQVGIGLTYRPASLCSLATQFQTRFLESIPRPIAGLKFPTLDGKFLTPLQFVLYDLFPCVLVGQHGSAWHTAEAEVSTAYRAFSKEKVMADLGINIGLNAVNVSLRALPVHNQSSSIDYNERFYWIGSSQMKHEYHNALVKVRIIEILLIFFGRNECICRSFASIAQFNDFFRYVESCLDS